MLAGFSIEPEAHCQVDVVCNLNWNETLNWNDLITISSQVPCGIYDDDGRIDGLKEDTTTIRKAMVIKISLIGTQTYIAGARRCSQSTYYYDD